MDLDLTGRNALVCGSTQGIGKASAVELARMGAHVTLLARDETRLKLTMEDLGGTAAGHAYLVADFAKPDEVRKTIQSHCEKNAVHILVNNTGGPPPGPAIEAAEEDFLTAFSQHLICNQILTRAVVPAMKNARFGRIINIISTSVKIPIRGLGVSNTVRGAVANWAKTLSVELAPFGITVNNVLPGATMTGRLKQIIERNAEKRGISYQEAQQEMVREIPAGRISEPHEVAAAVAFLASPAAAYINGVNIPVDGGRTGAL
jgi:3-oxoacyl-[acyl-carrier protein] reductase